MILSKGANAMPRAKKSDQPAGPLSQFEGRDVLAATMKVTKAGDGLSQALSVEPREFHHGDRVYLVIEALVSNVDFPPVPKTDALTRRHTLATETATLVDGDLVLHLIEEQREKNEAARLAAVRAKEAEAGVRRIPGTEPWDDETGDPGGDLPEGPSDDSE